MSTKSSSQVSTLDTAPDVKTDPVATDVVELKGANSDNNFSGKMEIVTIHTSQEDGGSDAVFVGHNGYAYQIPRDKPIKIPTEVAQILRDAVVTTYKPGAAGAVTERQMPRWAFSSVPA